jgi:hypothetical protein
MITSGTLNLPAGELHFAFQVLLAMRALKFELVGSHVPEGSLVNVNELRQQENRPVHCPYCTQEGFSGSPSRRKKSEAETMGMPPACFRLSRCPLSPETR